MSVTEYDGRVLDWRRSPDPRNQEVRYSVSTVIPPGQPRIRKMWAVPPADWRLDQGREGACTAFAGTHDLMASPVRIKVGTTVEEANQFARDLFQIVKSFDEWSGEAYDWSSVNGLMKALRALGYCDGWRWARDVEQVIDSLVAPVAVGGGPVIIGVPWLTRMFRPRPSGLLDVDGNVEGGHCVLVTGYNPRVRLRGETESHELVRIRQSWGGDHGRNGDVYSRVADLAELLDAGEATIPYGRKVPQ